MRANFWLSRRIAQSLFLCLIVFIFLGAGDDKRFDKLGHHLMCICGCNQVLLECNHVGCRDSDRMRNELTAALAVGGNQGDGAWQRWLESAPATILSFKVSCRNTE